MHKPNYRRRHYFIDRKFQGRFILQFSALVLLGGLLTIAFLYFLGAQSTTVAIKNSRVVAATTADFILPLLLQTVLSITAAVAITAGIFILLISHRISGPLYRFKKVAEALERGDFSSDFHIRSTDQFQELAAKLNKALFNIKQEVTALKNNIASLGTRIEALAEADFPENKRAVLAELKKVTKELDKTIRFFKT